jgi:hypothetical protein
VRRISHVPALLRSCVLAFEVGERHVHGVVTKRRIRMDSLTQPEPASGRLTIQELSRPATSEPDANVRKVMQADAAGVAFYDEGSDKSRIYAVDFPDAKGFVKEEIVVTPGLAFKRAWESSKPVIVNTNDPEELGPEIYALVVAEDLNGHCLIPLVSRGRTVGVLRVARKLEGSFTSEDVDFLSEASGQIAIAIENCLAYGEIVELKEKLAQEKLYLEDEIRSDMNFEQIVGNSPALKRLLQLVETLAPNDSTVLLLGEMGTGKELIARAIHEPQSAEGPYVCEGELCSNSDRPRGERVIWSRKGSIYGCCYPQDRPTRTGRPRHAAECPSLGFSQSLFDYFSFCSCNLLRKERLVS